MHVSTWSESGLNLTASNEAKRVIEDEGVRVRRHCNDFKAALCSDHGSVPHEIPANSLPHPVGIDEQVPELEDAINNNGGGETHDVVTVGGDSAQTFGDAFLFQEQGLWVGKESIAITLIGQ